MDPASLLVRAGREADAKVTLSGGGLSLPRGRGAPVPREGGGLGEQGFPAPASGAPWGRPKPDGRRGPWRGWASRWWRCPCPAWRGRALEGKGEAPPGVLRPSASPMWSARWATSWPRSGPFWSRGSAGSADRLGGSGTTASTAPWRRRWPWAAGDSPPPPLPRPCGRNAGGKPPRAPVPSPPPPPSPTRLPCAFSSTPFPEKAGLGPAAGPRPPAPRAGGPGTPPGFPEGAWRPGPPDEGGRSWSRDSGIS